MQKKSPTLTPPHLRPDPLAGAERGRPRVSPTAVAVTGTLAGFDPQGTPCVDLASGHDVLPLQARTCVDLAHADVGKEVALVFEDGDPSRPLIVGILRAAHALAANASARATRETAVGDGHVLDLSAADAVTLRCGAASITLRADGKVTIRGTEIECRASGLNRIQGGSVRIN